MECARLFVGGISQQTTAENLKEHFGKYGQVKESEIIKDRITGKGRGFGFVTFADHSAVAGALEDDHVLLGRMVEVKEAIPKHANQNQQYQELKINGSVPLSDRKIFVGGLPPDLEEKEFKEFFENFGVITDVAVIYNRETKKSRGFGFITFESKEAADNVLLNKFYELRDKHMEVKRATPRDWGGGGCSSSQYSQLRRYDTGLRVDSGYPHYFSNYHSMPMLPYGNGFRYYNAPFFRNPLPPFGNYYFYPLNTHINAGGGYTNNVAVDHNGESNGRSSTPNPTPNNNGNSFENGDGGDVEIDSLENDDGGDVEILVHKADSLPPMDDQLNESGKDVMVPACMILPQIDNQLNDGGNQLNDGDDGDAEVLEEIILPHDQLNVGVDGGDGGKLKNDSGDGEVTVRMLLLQTDDTMFLKIADACDPKGAN